MKNNVNNVRIFRERQLMSKAEVARRAGVSALTIDRVEKGLPCRMDTMRKILFGLGLSLEDQDKIFGEISSDEEDGEAEAHSLSISGNPALEIRRTPLSGRIWNVKTDRSLS